MSDSESQPSNWSPSGLGRKFVDPVIRAVRAEVASARAEVASRLRSARSGLIMMAAGAVLGLVTVMLLGALVVVVLALALPLWTATLITLAFFGCMSAALFASGIRAARRGLPLVPVDTITHAKSQLGSARE